MTLVGWTGVVFGCCLFALLLHGWFDALARALGQIAYELKQLRLELTTQGQERSEREREARKG